MIDIRTEIRDAFEREQSAFPPPAGLRAQMVAEVSSHAPASAPARPRADRNLNWLMGAGAILLAIAIVAGLMGSRLLHPISAKPGPAPQRCVPGTTEPSDRFARVHGCITYNDGSEIWAVDPYHPSNRISLGPSNGLTSIAWSRDGSRLLLTEQTDFGVAHEDLYVMNADGAQTRLTNDGGSTGGSFSPDGTKVVFARANDGLYVVDASGGTPRLIAKSHLAWWLESPAWSPDGSRIAYMVYLEGAPQPTSYEIWTVNPDGADPRLLVNLEDCGDGPCSGGLVWSPDGSILAFHSAHFNLSTQTQTLAIYVVHADGSGLHRINDNGADPSWAPDGSRLVFTRFPGYGPTIVGEKWGGELFTMAPDGSDLTLVVQDVVVVGYRGDVFGRPSGLAWNPVA